VKIESGGKLTPTRAAVWIVLGAALCPLVGAQEGPLKIKHIDVVMLSHLDVGFTDQPYLAINELHRRYLDVALDAVLATANKPPDQRFHWTEESMVPVLAWWRMASPERRQELLRAVESGQMDAAAMPFNTLPLENADEWKRMVPWAPDDLWKGIHPKVAIQDDVNGMSRAGMTALANHGIRELMMGLNNTWGGPPFPAPKAFWWKLPDGRRVFVYLARSYGQADDLFMPGEWRVGDSPAASDMAFRPPRTGEILPADDASVRAAHDRCVKKLADLEKRGYVGDRLIAVFANQWRMDNEVPFIPMVDFIAAWNRLKLQPELRLVTVSEAMGTMEKEIGDRVPEYEGVWPDWWTNGAPSTPRELAATRFAKRYLHAANSPLFGPMDAAATATENDILADLALSEEHTWGGGAYSVSLPDSLETAGQLDEKGLLAFRSNSRAAWLFSQRARTKLYPEQAGFYAINATGAPMSGWVTVPVMTLRGRFHSVRDKVSGQRIPLQFLPPTDASGRPVLNAQPTSDWLPYINDFPRPMARFWVDHLDANSVRVFELDSANQDVQPAVPAAFTAHTDDHGWPTSLQWPGMTRPLFQGAMGDFISIRSKSSTPYQAFDALATIQDATQRDSVRQRLFEEVPALAAGPVKIEETPYTVVYTQELTHPSLKWLIRRLEVWKQEPRARLDIRFDRLSSGTPEIYYVDFQLASAKGVLPQLSEGGMPFVPFRDQIPGSCKDFFAIDGWAHYATTDGDWLWVSRDAPVLSIGGPNVWTRLTEPPEHANRLFSMIFNNTWFTNFVSNSNGVMDFQYDLVWKKQIGADAGVLAESLVSDPVPLINPVARENPIVMKDLFKP
jgi:hypothetical protein